jgi:hypothetical protein
MGMSIGGSVGPVSVRYRPGSGIAKLGRAARSGGGGAPVELTFNDRVWIGGVTLVLGLILTVLYFTVLKDSWADNTVQECLEISHPYNHTGHYTESQTDYCEYLIKRDGGKV